MTRRQTICAVMVLFLAPSWGWAADGQASQSDSQASQSDSQASQSDSQAAQSGSQPATAPVFGDIAARLDGEPVALSERYSQWDARFGGWAMSHSGSPSKVGEYQDLNSSSFWDVDGLSSDGTKTFGITATGTDQETSVGNLHYYQPGLTVDVDYQRFLHELDHDPLNNMQAVTNPSTTPTWPPVTDPSTTASNSSDNPKIIKQDLGAGQDYAVRVQELKTSIKGDITDGLRVRLDVWGLQKDGVREANVVQMCYNGPNSNGSYNALPPDHLGLPSGNLGPLAGKRCHVLSQPQQIDWITREIKPVIEAHLGDSLVLEYSRPMRAFTAADSATTCFYDRFGSLSYDPIANPNPYDYGVVPNSYTQMDQLKLSGRLGENNKVYAFLMAGSTVNQEIGMDRWFNDVDFRLTNTSLRNLTLTGYGTVYNENEQMPNAATVTSVNQGPATDLGVNTLPTEATVTAALEHPIDYHKSTAGLRSTWRPWGGGFTQQGLAITAGYEYCDLERQYAIYDLAVPAGGVLDESHTITNSFQVGPDYRWSAAFDTFLRYKYQNANQPLIGVQESNGLFNTPLPQQDHIVEMGFNWFPSDCFMFNACVGIEMAENHSQYADFDEENYPMSFTAWYAVSQKWSLSAGYAIYSNFIAQNISVADETTYTTGSTSAAPPSTSRWNYGGQAHVVTVGSRYAFTECVTLTVDGEWTRGRDLINNSTITLAAAGTNPVVPGGTITDLGSYSEVSNESSRIRVGADWKIRPRVVIYGRYEFYYFHDIVPGYQSGLAQGILGGFSALF